MGGLLKVCVCACADYYIYHHECIVDLSYKDGMSIIHLLRGYTEIYTIKFQWIVDSYSNSQTFSEGTKGILYNKREHTLNNHSYTGSIWHIILGQLFFFCFFFVFLFLQLEFHLT